MNLVPDFVNKAAKSANDVIEKVKCISEAISDAVKETDYEPIWDEYKKELEKLHDKFKACKNEANIWEEIK